LTVVDRFGRTDAETLQIAVQTLAGCCEWRLLEPIENGLASIDLDDQRGRFLSGRIGAQGALSELAGRFSGELIDDQTVRLQLPNGIALAGILDLSRRNAFNAERMDVTQIGGAHSGRRLTFLKHAF
jgi:hypothetical protein